MLGSAKPFFALLSGFDPEQPPISVFMYDNEPFTLDPDRLDGGFNPCF